MRYVVGDRVTYDYANKARETGPLLPASPNASGRKTAKTLIGAIMRMAQKLNVWLSMRSAGPKID